MAKLKREFFPPLKNAYVTELEKLWLENSKELFAAREREKNSQYGDDYTEAFEVTKPLLLEPGHGAESHGPTVVALAVDFRQHTNKSIGEAFLKWLKGNRPADCPEPVLAGKKTSDLKYDLKCLGVMRLLHCCTFDEIEKVVPEVWASVQFSGNKWCDRNKWYEARRQAKKTLHEVFPFLGKDEEPLSYVTAAEMRRRKVSISVS